MLKVWGVFTIGRVGGDGRSSRLWKNEAYGANTPKEDYTMQLIVCNSIARNFIAVIFLFQLIVVEPL